MAKTKEIERLKKELAKKEDQLRFFITALDNLPNAVFIKNEKAEFVFFNRKYEEIFGMDRNVFVGKRVLDLEYLPEEDRERYQKEDINLIETSSILTYEVDFMFSDNKIHPSLYWSRGFRKEDEVKGLIGEIVDITKYSQQKENTES